MIRVIMAFIVLLIAVWLGIQVSHDPGYVLIAINHWTIESTLWVAVFALIILFVALHIFLQLLHKLTSAPNRFRKWRALRLAHKAQETTRQGLIEYSEGYWKKAKQHLIQALPNTDTPLLNYLTAARAAQKMGDSQLRDHYLREAQQSMPEAKIAVELTQAQLQLANNQSEQALATLRHLQDLAPKHPYVLKLLANLYEQVRDWTHLIALLPDLKKNHVMSDHEFEELQQHAYLSALRDLAKQQQPDALHILFHNLPKSLSNNAEIIAEYVRFLLSQQREADAENILRKSLRKEFNDKLINIYGLIHYSEDQLVFAESLLKKNPHSSALYLCLGRLSIANQLWGKAKHYLEQAKVLTPTPETYFALGTLHDRMNEPTLANHCYKEGLELAIQMSGLHVSSQ